MLLGVVLEVKAVELSQLAEVVLAAEDIALVFIADQLHPDDLDAVLQLVLVELEVDLLLPLLQLTLRLLDAFVQTAHLIQKLSIPVFQLQDLESKLAFSFILLFIGVEQLLMILLLSHPLLQVELY